MFIGKCCQYSEKHLDCVLNCVGPSPSEPRQKCVAVYFARLKNLLFGDHHWYNNAQAAKLIQEYLWGLGAMQRGSAKSATILAIFDRLVTSQSDVLGIRREWINNKAPCSGAFRPVKRVPIASDKLLFHLHAGEFGEGSQFQGLHQKVFLDYLRRFLKGRQKQSLSTYGIKEETLTQLSKTLMIEDYLTQGGYISQARRQIGQALMEQKPLLMSSGWSNGTSGHAMFYEVVPESKDRLTLRVFNLGSGVHYHAKAEVGIKQKYHPYCEWRGIEAKKLLDPAFLKIFYRVDGFSLARLFERGKKYGGHTIYGALRELLGPTSEGHVDQNSIFMSSHHVGICTYKSLMAFMRTKMSEEQYKLMKLDLRVQSLVDFVGSGKGGLKKSQNWRLIMKSHQRTCRSIEKLQKKGLLKGGDLQNVNSQLQSVEKWIEANRNKHHKRAKGLMGVLTGFEHISKIRRSGKFISLERFGLKFVRERKQWKSDQFPGYFLRPEATFSNLQGYSNYLMLENNKGEKKLLLPMHKFLHLDREDQESLSLIYRLNRKLRSKKQQKYAMFDIDQNGQLSAKSREDLLYLVLVLGVVQNYRMAGILLRECMSSSTPFNKQELEILDQVFSMDRISGDNEGNAIALRTLAGYLAAKVKGFTYEHMRTLVGNYSRYLRQLNHATEVKLTDSEELHFLSCLNLSGVFQERYEQLKDPSRTPPEVKVLNQAAPLEKHVDVRKIASLDCPKRISKVLACWKKCRFFLEQIFHPQNYVTPQEKINSNFFHYYKVAKRSDQKSKKWLQKALVFMRHAKKEEDRSIGFILQAVMDHPEKFQTLPKGNLDSWWKETLAICAA